ncbi:hypothetical protein PHLCEN_2v11469 [Hermanssonia centrifuga]|uniref:Uncharacterized protein n=1 Tax=Hermanssonia centrifuga TaxID=98765 RepID=A0A2R6NK28_9APHY|nr:hypothetical protein PHLCEN_2v11469 [Hermanssonia centrifuga]
MDVTQIFYAPPLTSNTLESYQRARLVRSTRKLGAVLGTTPRLVEPEPIPIKLLPIGRSSTSSLSSNGHNSPYGYHHGYPRSYTSVKASPSINSVYSSSSSNSSVVSLTLPPTYSSDVLPTPKSFSSKPRRSANTPHPLVLRVNTVPVKPSDIRVPMSPFTASIVPIVPGCTEPDTPVVPSAAEVRRKRMAKLTRTLGENIPPEIVFPPTTSTSNARSAPTQRQLATAVHPIKRSSRVWMTGSNLGTWTGEWNRKDIKEVQKKLRTLKAR